ncbi:NAD(P)-binding protein [Stipitochalara longipes BDJ]|nr:NAD(P)-binding protein [Stipitochalara longipes BDJ]
MTFPQINFFQIGLHDCWRDATQAKEQLRKHAGMFWNNTAFGPKDPVGKKQDFRDKTIVMIGAASDIGAEAAVKIARLNAEKLIIGVPDVPAGEDLRDRIQREADRSGEFCWLLKLDMSSYPSVDKFVNEVQHITPKVHAVVLFANHESEDVADERGRIIRSLHATELHLQINVISTAYLAIFLLALLLETSLAEHSQTRLEFVGSESYDTQKPFHTLLNVSNSSGLSILQYLNRHPDDAIQYQTTKFLQMGVMTQLAKRVDPSNVLVFDAEPGLCEKPTWKGPDSELPGSTKRYKKLFVRTFEQGSRTIVSGLLWKPELKCMQGLHGRIWRDDSAATPRKMVHELPSQICIENAWAETMSRFRYMRNWRAMRDIVPDGQGQINAKRIQLLRRWYPRPGIAHQNKDIKRKYFPLTSDHDLSFWRGTLADIVPNYEHDQQAMIICGPSAVQISRPLTDETEERFEGIEGLVDEKMESPTEKSVKGAEKSSRGKIWRTLMRFKGNRKMRGIENTKGKEKENMQSTIDPLSAKLPKDGYFSAKRFKK